MSLLTHNAASRIAAVNAAMASARHSTSPVILLVSPTTASNDPVDAIREHFGWPVVHVGQTVSQKLLDVPRLRRPLEVESALRDQLEHVTAQTVLLDRLELLFLPDLAADPVMLLTRLARDRQIVARWPGGWTNSTLTYAEPGHPEHRTWHRPGVEVVDIRAFP